MVWQKKLDYALNGYQVPPIPRVPKSAKGKRSVRKKIKGNQVCAGNQMCAFDLLAAVAGKLLLEGEGSLINNGTFVSNDSKDLVRKEQVNDVKALKDEAFDLGSCSEATLGSDVVIQKQVSCIPNGCSKSMILPAPAPSSGNVKSGKSNKDGPFERQYTCIDKPCEGKVNERKAVYKSVSDPCNLEDHMDIDTKPLGLVSSISSVDVPSCVDRTLHNSFSPKCQDENHAVDRDDDENSSGCTHPRMITKKALNLQGIGDCRIRKKLAPKFWKLAPAMTKDREPSNTEMKPSLSRKVCYTRQRTQRSLFKRRSPFRRCSVATSDGGVSRQGIFGAFGKDIKVEGSNSFASLHRAKGISSSNKGHISSYKSEDFHVKLSIKSFKVPELFIDIPETSTVGSLKRTVVEAVTAILGGGLRVGVLLQGKKVRDDSKTLLQAGISHCHMLDDLGFTLEPCPNQAPPHLTSPEEPRLLPPCGVSETLARFPVVAFASDGGKSDVSPKPPLTPIVSCPESDHDSVHLSMDASSQDRTTGDSHALVAVPALSFETVPLVPVRKPRRSELIQRRIRRPFSVSEVEALVQAVEKLGTGRWRDVKLRAFDNAKHRTYVDLKDKWKTLVHTARISPQQRRGEPVPQELLDRVLSAHAYWSQQQAKLQQKSPPAETCLLL